MSLPVEPDFALIKIETAAGPPAVFAVLCGIEGVTVSRTTQIQERYRRDCAKPNRPGQRRITASGSSWKVAGTGVINVDQRDVYDDAEGVLKNYKIEYYRDDGTDAGELLGTDAGSGMLSEQNSSTQTGGDSEASITIEGQGLLVWTAA